MSVQEEEIKRKSEAYIRAKRTPTRLRELRKSLGLTSDRSGELRRLLEADDRFFKVGSSWYIKGANLKIKVRFCPNCGYKKVNFEGGFYRCPNCETRFHFTWLM
jgi:NADH pyrophosphatase NudC (nudix superfamily)